MLNEYFEFSNLLLDNVELTLPVGRLATGIEFSTDERYLFVNTFSDGTS